MANIIEGSERWNGPVLKQIYGENINKKHKLTGSAVIIGKSPVCEIQLSSSDVSSMHCCLSCSDSDWKVEDLQSSNGTFVNGRKLELLESYHLQYGDIVCLGSPSENAQAFELLYRFESDDDDDDITELPIRPDQDSEITVVEIVEKFNQNSDIQTLGSKNLASRPEGNQDPEITSREIAGEFNQHSNFETLGGENHNGLSSIHSEPQVHSYDLRLKPSRSQLSSGPSGSDHGGNPKNSNKKRKYSQEDNELKTQLAELSQKNEMLVKKNEELELELSDKKKLEFSLQCYEMEAKQKVKREMLENLEQELICSICTELFIMPVILSCSHTFCEYCIEEWRKNKNDCPTCRDSIIRVQRVLTMEEYIDKTLATLTPQQRIRRNAEMKRRCRTENSNRNPRVIEF